jgi:hypothetical protein
MKKKNLSQIEKDLFVSFIIAIYSGLRNTDSETRADSHRQNTSKNI